MWRTLSTPDGRRVVGDAIAGELEAQVAEAFSYDADDPRFDAEAAAALEREARWIRRGPALRAECAAPSYENGGEDVSAEDVADAKRSVKLQKVAHPDDGVVPEAIVYGGPVLDRALSAKPQWDVGRAAVNFYIEVLVRVPGDESVRQ